MNLVGFLFPPSAPRKYLEDDFGSLELDLVLEETHEWKVEATTNPVETGSPISDHIILHPDKLRVRGFISDQSINLSFNLFDKSKYGSQSKTEFAFEMLRGMMKGKDVVTIYTKNRTYPNMVMTDLTIPRSSTIGEAMEVTMEFLEIRKVTTILVDLPKGISSKKEGKSGTPNQRKGESSKDAGKKTVEDKSSSFASRLLGK